MGRSNSRPIRLTTLLLVGTLGLAAPAIARQAPSDPAPPEVQALARGPIHEAYLGPILFNPATMNVTPQAPPSTQIEELPPEFRPEGVQVEWIPGYWAWDEGRASFLWVSGVWRDVPPGRQWIPGYWSRVPEGSRRTPGFWAANASRGHFDYLPTPPASLEAGPDTPRPSPDSIWVPGSWSWDRDRHAWQPGSWLRANPDWVWTPGRTLTTPAGSLDIDGYWDYPLPSRGLAFASVAFAPSVIARRNFPYSPSNVLPVDGLLTSLHLRPEDGNYTYGIPTDAASRGPKSDVIPWFDLQKSGVGYDPVYASMSALNGQSPDWDRKLREDYRARAEVRPEAQASAESGLIPSLSRWASDPDSGRRLVPVKATDRLALSRQSDFRAFRQERAKREARPRSLAVGDSKANGARKIELPRSPVASTIATQADRQASLPISDRYRHPRVNQSFRPSPERESALIRQEHGFEHPEPREIEPRRDAHERLKPPAGLEPPHGEPGPARPLPEHRPIHSTDPGPGQPR